MDKTPDIRLVVFDIGRVLLRLCDDIHHACRRAGVELDLDKVHPSALIILDDLACRHDVGLIDIHGFAREASEALGLTPEQVLAMSDRFLYHAFSGVPELVDELNARGIDTACLSNTNASHWRIMNDPAEEAHLPLHRLTHRFASHLVRLRKPDPAIYAHVERETGIAPNQIVFFDDVIENVEAAISRGWKAHRVDPRSENPIPMIRGELARLGLI